MLLQYQYRPAHETTCGRGCIFCRACSGRGKGSNCCRCLHTHSLEKTPMAIRGVSLLDMDFSKEFPFQFAVQSYGCTKLNVMYTNDTDSVKLCLASVLWLHQVLEHSPVSSATPTAPSLLWGEGRMRRFGHLVQQAC